MDPAVDARELVHEVRRDPIVSVIIAVLWGLGVLWCMQTKIGNSP